MISPYFLVSVNVLGVEVLDLLLVPRQRGGRDLQPVLVVVAAVLPDLVIAAVGLKAVRVQLFNKRNCIF